MDKNQLNQQETVEKKQLIIDTAKKLILKHGFSNTSLNQIKEAANVSKGLIYYHFENKDALGIQVLESVFDEEMSDFEGFSKFAQKIEDRTELLTHLDEYLDHFIVSMMQDRTSMPIIVDLLLNLKSEKSKIEVKELYMHYINEIANFLKFLDVEYPILNAKLIISILDGILYLDMVLNESMDEKERMHVIHALKCMVGLEELK